MIDCWGNTGGSSSTNTTSDLCTRNPCPNYPFTGFSDPALHHTQPFNTHNGTPNDKVVGILALPNGYWNGVANIDWQEAVQSKLNTTMFNAAGPYVLKMWIRQGDKDYNTSNLPVKIDVNFNSTNPPTLGSYVQHPAYSYTTSFILNNYNDPWIQYVSPPINVPFGSTWDYIIIGNAGGTGGNTNDSYVFIDDVELIPVLDVQIVNPNLTVCNGGILHNLDANASYQNLTGSSFTITMSGPGVVPNSSGDWDFNSNLVGAGTYTITTTITQNLCDGSPYTAANAFTITVNQSVPIIVSNPAPICAGSCASLTASSAGSYTYSWSNSGTGNTISVCPPVTTTYTVNGTDALGCLEQATGTVTVVQPQPVTITQSPGDNTCNASSVYAATNIAGATYLWSVTTGTITAGQGTNTLSVNWSPSAATQTVTVVVTQNSICTSTVTVIVPGCCSQPDAINFDNLTIQSGAGGMTNIPVGTYTGTITVSSPFTFAPLSKIFVTNTLTFGAGNYTMNSNDVIFNSGAQIICLAGCTLTVNRSHLHACNFMWRNIQVNTNARLIMTQSLVEDGIRAVILKNNSYFSASRTYFNKDSVGITAAGHTTTPTANFTVGACLFTCRNISPTYTLGQVLPPPNSIAITSYPVSTLVGTASGTILPNSKTTKSGIEMIFNSVTFTVGIQLGAGGSNVQTNYFDFVNRGIFNWLARVFIYNNHFQNITAAGKNAPEAGVRILGGFIPPFATPGTTITRVGNGTNPAKNIFEISTRGVYATLFSDLSVQQNTLKNISLEGVNFEKWGSGTQTTNPVFIADNTFKNTRTGVLGFANGKIYATISGNSVSNPAFFGSSIGINLQEMNTSNAVQYIVQDNIELDTLQEGIICNNLNGGGTALNVRIQHNKIINRPSILGGLGDDVRITNCDGIYVFNNNCKANPVVASGNVVNFGIYTSQSTNIIEYCNSMNGVGVPIKFDGPACTPGSYVVGNNLQNGTYGIWLNNGANIGDIAFPFNGGYASDNKWGAFTSGCYSNSTLGANPGGFFIKRRTAPPAYVPTGSACAVGGTQLIGQVAPAFNPPLDASCNPPLPLAPAPGGTANQNAIADLLNNSFNFPANDAEFKFSGRKKILQKLREGIIDPSLNPAFSSFITANSNTSLGKFYVVDSLTHHGTTNFDTASFSSARAINNSVTVSTTMEQYQRDFNNLHLSYLQYGTLTGTEISQTKFIAGLCPFTDGVAVYQARALLIPFDTTQFFNSCEFSVNSGSGNRMASGNNVPDNENNIIVYPNPTEDELFISIKESSSENLQFTMFDAMGRLVMNKKINVQNGIANFSVKEIPAGIYFYKLTSGETILKQERLIISK